MQRTTLLIELAGAHGVGKSTIAPILAEQLLRNKKIHTRLHGAERENQAREHRAKLEGLASDLIQKALLSFARNFCEPPLDAETIETICVERGERTKTPQDLPPVVLL